MPNCFNLTRKTDLDAGPVALAKVDEELCARFQEPVHETKWFRDWYNIIGFSVAMGRTLPELIERYANPGEGDDKEWYAELYQVAEWLDANFTTSAWAEIGRR